MNTFAQILLTTKHISYLSYKIDFYHDVKNANKLKITIKYAKTFSKSFINKRNVLDYQYGLLVVSFITNHWPKKLKKIHINSEAHKAHNARKVDKSLSGGRNHNSCVNIETKL